ncbi:zonadhesin isoform X3 [Pungitius pungitius]|uniref:zonadhesin isoform X3 n=1 Tax=Pungitius pungitius TaxID=134920 RepID=UPI002E0FB8FA
MLGGILTNVLVTGTLLFVTQTVTRCRGEIDFSSVTLPDWRTDSEYVTQCVHDSPGPRLCDWKAPTDDAGVTALESGPLRLEGEACLEFWYLSPVATNGTEPRVLLKSSGGLIEIWTLPPRHRDAWRQVFVPLDIINPGTQVVIEAASTEGQFEFNRMGVRRGSCGPQCDSDTELWTDESTRCLCHGGQLSCSPSQCPESQACTPQREASTGTCTVHSHTDCSTFDGELLRFMVPCTYTLAKTCSPSEAMPMFAVEVVNKQSRNSPLPTVEEVVVNMGNFRVSLLKRETSRIVVNGVWKKLPLRLGGGTVNIKSNPAAVELGTSFGLLVSYDNAGAVHVTLPSRFSDKVCGLCGNYNHDRQDDFTKPDGTFAQNATAFAQSWQSGQASSPCEAILVPHQCDPLQVAEYASEQYCGGLVSSSGPFADCLSVLEGESYFRGCVASMCSSHGDPAALCGALQVYSDICQEAGASVPMWRNSSHCPLLCGENSHYNSCADGCPEVCSSLDMVGLCGSCEERCECDSGLKLSGGKCVPAEECGCWYDGKHYENGATFSKGECKHLCQCMGNNDMQCTAMQCTDKEVCKVKDGVKGCFPFKPATCSVYGDPHYITFDGLAYDFQGGCSYTLTTTCAEDSAVRFTVIGHNVHPGLQDFTRSKLEAVALQVEDLHLTLNQSGEVYVNNSLVRLPYSTNGAIGSVWVYLKKNNIILETTFGLRMTIDARNRLFLQVDERYMHELCGLCGTYSELQDDDFVTPGGQNATGSFEFGDSWRLPGDNECISHPSDPRHCDYDEEDEAYNECSTLLGDAFTPCHELIHPKTYVNSCVYDYCATNGDQHTLCDSLESYAAACQFAGVELLNWQLDTACAEPPTTTAHPTPSTATSPTTDHSLCPVNCDFEKNLCGWEQLLQDSFDWKRHSGSTPSSLTGPDQDHTTGAGFYMYIDGNNVTHGDSARLWSSMCNYQGPLCLRFWYHMYGSATSMALNIYLLKDNKATKLWVMMNNQGPEWHQGIVDIPVSGPFQIIIEGIRGSNALSDVAIDDISIHLSSCSGNFPGLVGGTKPPSLTAVVIPSLPICNMDCSFDSNLCSWNQMVTDSFDWTWQNGSTSTPMTGPSADHTGDGHYLYIEASSVNLGDTARLISSECSESGPQCLQFWYHMYGSADTMGLHVYLLQNKVADAVWWERNDHGNIWKLAQLDITTTGAFQIIFEGRRGSNHQSDVAIDDVILHRGYCTVATVGPEFPATATQTHSSPSSKPQPTLTATLTQNTDLPTTKPRQPITSKPIATTTTGPTATATPFPPTTGHPEVVTPEKPGPEFTETASPEPPTASTDGPPTTARPHPPITGNPGLGTPEHPEPETTAGPEQPATSNNGLPTTAGPHPPTTEIPGLVTPEHPKPEMTARPEQPATSTDGLPTSAGPHPPTTKIPGIGTPEQPEHEFTEKPQTTASPEPPTASTDGPPTTARPHPPTTGNPGLGTPEHPEPEMTAGPEQPATSTDGPPTTARPHPPTTEIPGLGTPEHPEPEMTAGPEQPATSTDGPPTTARPHPPTTENPGLGTPEHPEPEMTAGPEQPATSANGLPTTGGPHPPTTGNPGLGTPEHPEPETTAGPEQPATSTDGPPTTARPHPPTTGNPGLGTPEHPEPEMTAGPEQPATSTDGPPTTARPHPPTTGNPGLGTPEHPEPEMTAGPEQPATSANGLPTTGGPHPPTTGNPGLGTPEHPEPETTAGPEQPATSANGLPTTGGPHPPTTENPGLGTPEHPEPETTAGPEQPATSTDGPPTTGGPHPPTTENPGLGTPEQPEPEMTAVPEQPATSTDGPQPTTAAPHLSPVRPHSTTTTAPQRTTTNKPYSTIGRPLPTTTPQPQTTHVPTPSCPENSHYTTCIPQCSPTCEHLNGPSDCSDSEGCVKGCVCDGGFVRTSKACVPIQRCGCMDRNGTRQNFNKEWYTDHCSKKCKCEKDDGVGKIDCDDKDECGGKAVCLQNEEGNYYCQSTGFGQCTIRGDSEYRTFDELKHDFEGKHSYVLVSTNNLPYYLPHVYIEATNTVHDEEDSRHHGDDSSEEDNARRSRDKDDGDEDDEDDSKHDDDSEEHKEHHRLRELKIRVYDHTVVFKKNRKLIVDGRETKTPTSPTAGLNISLHSSRIYLKTDFGLSVEFDGRDAAEIILPNLYKRKVGGLCGNFDGHKGNDQMKLDGTRAKSIKKFGDSWKV